LTTRPFLIRNPETKVTFELNDVQFFVDTYQGEGFEIVNPPPTGYCVPELPKAKPAKAEKSEPALPKAEKAAAASKLD